MKGRIYSLASLFIILLVIVTSVLLYPYLPEKIAIHWNIMGDADGFMPKSLGSLLFPIITLGTYLILIALPKIDPDRANIKAFRKQYDSLVFTIMLFLSYLYLLTLVWNMVARFNMVRYISPAFSILFYMLG